MPKIEIPFIGGAYTQRSPITNTQRSINCFPVIDNKEAKNVISMYGTPGLKLYKLLSSFGPPTDIDITVAGTFTNLIDVSATASASSELESNVAANAVDDSDSTRWAASNKTLIEYASATNFPTTTSGSDTIPSGALNNIYVALDTGNAYEWSATALYYALRTTLSLANDEYKGNYIPSVPTFTIDTETYWQIDFGSGNAKAINKVRFQAYVDDYGQALKGIVIKGSNNLSTWRNLRITELEATTDKSWIDVSVPNVIAYRYIRIYFTSTYRRINDGLISVYEIQMGTVDNVLNRDLQCDNLTVNAGVTLDTCGYSISVSDTLTNNGIITDTVSGGNGGSGGSGGIQPSITSNCTGNSGEEGNSGVDAAKDGAGAGGDGGNGAGAGADVKVVPGGKSKAVTAYGGNGGQGGFGGRGGGRINIYANTLTNNGTIHANGFNGGTGYDGRVGEVVGSSGILIAGSLIFSYIAYLAGGGGGGGKGGNGGDGGSVNLYYVTRTVGTVTATAGTGGAGGNGGNGGTTPKGTPFSVCPKPTDGEGGTGATGAGDGGGSYGAHPFTTSTDSADNGTGGANGDDGEDGSTSWTELVYPTVIDSNEIRCFQKAGSNLYVVMGSSVFKIDSSGNVASIGSIYTSTGDVDMAYNGTQILIVDGTTFGCYIDDSDVVHLITDPDFPAATSCAFMDGYFIVTSTDTGDSGESIPGRVHVSGSYDASTWDALDYSTAEGHPDRVLCAKHINNNLWLFGEESTEVWYNTGNSDLPFARIPGALIDEGTTAAKTVVLINDQFFWLTHKREVVCNVGYQRQKISTLHIDYLIQSMTVVSDAKGFTYRIDGHVFYVLTFPTEARTLVYDLSTDFWHEWSSFITSGVETYGQHRGNCSVFFNGKWIVGDYSNGKLYELDMGVYKDDDDLIKRTRRTMVIRDNGKRVFHHSIELLFEPGVGLPAGSAEGLDPEVSLSWSDDYCNSWTTGRVRKLGAEGEYSNRVFWNRLGQSRHRVYELTTSEPVRFAMIGCISNIEGSHE